MSGSSTGRRCGPRSGRAPTWPCSSPAPAPDLPKHQGITYFALDMHQPGVDVRPLREMTGHAMFNETFLTDARVPTSSVIGGLNNGWAVANTTLGHERSGLGSGGGSAAVAVATPGTVAGNLPRRAGDFVPAKGAKPRARSDAAGRAARRAGMQDLLVDLARGNGTGADPAHPTGPGPPLHAQRARPVQRRAAEGGPEHGSGCPRHGQHRQAVHEQHRAAPTGRQPADRRGPGHCCTPTTRPISRCSTRPPATPSCRR